MGMGRTRIRLRADRCQPWVMILLSSIAIRSWGATRPPTNNPSQKYVYNKTCKWYFSIPDQFPLLFVVLFFISSRLYIRCYECNSKNGNVYYYHGPQHRCFFELTPAILELYPAKLEGKDHYKNEPGNKIDQWNTKNPCWIAYPF